MKFILAPDSFKESMSAKEAAEAMQRGIKRAMPEALCVRVPMADGGEGTLESLLESRDAERVLVEVKDPLMRKVQASYGILEGGKSAVIEIAQASGIHLVDREQRNPLIASSYGVGELIKNALDRKVKHILIGLGGSASNDGGVGMLRALGARFLDKEGKELEEGGAALKNLNHLDLSALDSRLKSVAIEVACDVNCELVGEQGASMIFGAQKGASASMIKELDTALSHYAQTIVAGAGAAGGLGAGTLLLNAHLQKGIDLIIKHTQLEEKIKGADFVFTGEGSIDYQTLFGKTALGVSLVAQRAKVPVVVFAGNIGKGAEALYDYGIRAMFGILPGVCDLKQALKEGAINLQNTTENVVRLIGVKRPNAKDI
ncbi:glycerate kinase family protein [Helicobacter suis]|uniref:glycerate kinase family protein n=1 Tax=Helicobacter suis TaxID=104628 RepID=UPI0001F7A7CE|nr:glycerate kinase [Helicobacter suis]EFX43129.1 Glycerate kinase [Helicobacter suis HS1]BDR29057.1 glycerate kinase [Helicobacter suis HS1]